jgi:hypothetical protein
MLSKIVSICFWFGELPVVIMQVSHQFLMGPGVTFLQNASSVWSKKKIKNKLDPG